jgi:hypothetical protein
MVELAETSILELTSATQFLHVINPKLRDRIVIGIEKSKPDDRSIVFHLIERNKKERETELFMLSAEYIIEHPYWNT